MGQSRNDLIDRWLFAVDPSLMHHPVPTNTCECGHAAKMHVVRQGIPRGCQFGLCDCIECRVQVRFA